MLSSEGTCVADICHSWRWCIFSRERDCDDDDGQDDNEVDNNDDSGIAITIPMLGWDLDTAGSNQRLNKTSPAQHTIMVMMMMR